MLNGLGIAYSRTGPFPFLLCVCVCVFFFFFFFFFFWGGGGVQMCLPESLIPLPESRICFGNAFLSHMGGGGGRYLEEENTTVLK